MRPFSAVLSLLVSVALTGYTAFIFFGRIFLGDARWFERGADVIAVSAAFYIYSSVIWALWEVVSEMFKVWRIRKTTYGK